MQSSFHPHFTPISSLFIQTSPLFYHYFTLIPAHFHRIYPYSPQWNPSFAPIPTLNLLHIPAPGPYFTPKKPHLTLILSPFYPITAYFTLISPSFHPRFTLVSPSFHPHFTPLLALFNSFWAVSPLLTPMKSLFHLYFTPISPPFHPHFTLRSPIKYLSDLSHNELTVCESNGFKPLSKLEILKLNNNSISTLEEKAFIGLYAIREM